MIDHEEENDDSYLIIEDSPDGKWYASFEDDGRVAYLYLGKYNNDNSVIHDDLWIYNKISPPIEKCKEVFLFWTEDSAKVGLIVDQECWGIYDLKSWRKLNAPREGNIIKTISKEIWDKGVTSWDGEKIKPLK
jgi:hypothetical protein